MDDIWTTARAALGSNRQIALRAGAALLAGAGVFALRHIPRAEVDAAIAPRTRIARVRTLAEALAELRVLEPHDSEFAPHFEAVLEAVDAFLLEDERRVVASQGRMSRLAGEVERVAAQMCACAEEQMHASDDAFVAVLRARDEVVPRIVGMLEDALWNHLLDR